MRLKSLLVIGLILLVTSFLSGCDALSARISGAFTSPTPTASATPTATVTPTATATPPAPLTISPCPTRNPCGSAVAVDSFIDTSVKPGVVYSVTIPFDAAVSFRAGWIARDEFILQQNLVSMTPFFGIDGQSYFLPEFIDYEPYADDSGSVYDASWVGVDLSGWRPGETHRIRLGYIINDTITNGWEVFQAGTVIEYIYVVNPSDAPVGTITPSIGATLAPGITPTETPSPTRTRVPTSTPRPSATLLPRTATPTLACSLDSSILINNRTGGTITLYLTGPARFTFYIPIGTQTISVCAGTYDYTAYACSGSRLDGTMTSGEQSEFRCQ